jgi:hypothetical protein
LIERRRQGADAWFESVLDHAIVLTRLQPGMDFLLNLIEQDGRNRRLGHGGHQPPAELAQGPRPRRQRRDQKSRNERVQLAFRKFFPELDLDPRRY